MLDKIKWLWRYYRRHLYVLGVLVILTPVQTSLQVLLPKLFGITLDFLNKGKEVLPDYVVSQIEDFASRWDISSDLSYPLAFALGYAGLGLIATMLYAFVQAHRAWMNLKLEWLFRQDAFNDITSKGPDFFNRFRTGDIITRLTDDVADKLSWFACSGIFRFYEALLMVGFTIYMMLNINVKLTLYSAGPLPLLIVIFFLTSSLLDKRYAKLQERISKFNDVMESVFSGIRVVKAYVQEKAQKIIFGRSIEERRVAEIETVKVMTVVESLYSYIWQFGVVIVLIAGGNMVIQSELTTGQMASFIMYVIWLVFPMFDIGQFLVKSRQSAVSINRLGELEKMPPMVTENGSETFEAGKISIDFDQVSFGFKESTVPIVDKLDFTIEPGQTIALVGKVGSGKSWLVNMLPRLVDPTGGQIRIGGHDLKRFKLEDLRRTVGYVPQEPVLFSDTVRNNIVFGRDNVSEATLEWALEVSQLAGEIAAFPKGLDTEIGTRGMSISGGQKQRLALARALVGKPNILILDDCTSALDSSTESALWDRLHEVLPDMTAIVITHRTDTLEKADRIYVLERGRIIESGRHSKLIADEGHYAQIYRRYSLEEDVAS